MTHVRPESEFIMVEDSIKPVSTMIRRDSTRIDSVVAMNYHGIGNFVSISNPRSPWNYES